MSEVIKWRYLPAEKDLAERIKATEAEHYVKPNPSVVAHWGIASRVAMLKAIYQDQKDGLHSLIGHGRCSCGLEVEARIESLTLALLKSEHHRNHRTLKPEIPVFRGMVGRRLFALNSSQNSLDQTWDELVLGYAAGSHSGIRFIPSAFTAFPITE